jgi:cytoskeleton protein RodZ
MKKTGEFLRKAREDKGLSVHEIGLSLKINPKILKQIEDGDRDNLPAKTFLRGFVQSYALFLKIDPNEVLKIFSDEMGTTKPHQISLTSGPQIKGNGIDIEDPENKDDLGIKRHTGQNFSKEKFEFKNVGIGIVVFVLLLSLIAVRKVVEKYQKEAEVDMAKTEETLKSSSKLELPQAPPPATPLPTAENKPVQPAADSKALTGSATGTAPIANPNDMPKLVVKPQPTPPVTTPPAAIPGPSTATTVKPATTAPTPPPPTLNPAKPSVAEEIKKPAPPVPIPAPPVVKKSVEEIKKPVVNDATAATAAMTPPKEEPKKPKNIELVIEAYEMTQSTGKVEKIRMTPSQIQTFKTVSGVKLNISNGGAVNLIVNGKEIGVPGDLGKPKRVSF